MFRLLLLMGVLLAGCSPPVATPRPPAHRMVLDVAYLDSLDASEDAVDWHQIDVPASGRLTIHLVFESRDAPLGRVEVHDANVELVLDADLLAFGNTWVVDASPGQYFVKIRLDAGAMTYRIMASLDA